MRIGSTRVAGSAAGIAAAALVHAGREQPVEVHALAHAINDALGAFGTDGAG